MDLSPFIAWSVPLFGIYLAAKFGSRRAAAGAQSIWAGALMVSLGIGFVLVIPQVAIHGICIEAKLCLNRGDVNMSYWFQSFFAIPLYWLMACAVWQMKQ